jgi:hypothetical protein
MAGRGIDVSMNHARFSAAVRDSQVRSERKKRRLWDAEAEPKTIERILDAVQNFPVTGSNRERH